MKKVVLVLTLVFASFVSFSQQKEDSIKNDVFYTSFKSGAGEKIPVNFAFPKDFLEKLQKSEVYLLWKERVLSNPKNVDTPTVELYLKICTWTASFYAKLGLKNSTSYTPIANSEGFIYINDKGEVNFSFPYKAQNGYGNMIISKAFYTEKIKDGKIVNTHF